MPSDGSSRPGLNWFVMLAGLVCLVAIACASDGDSEQDEPIPRASPVETIPAPPPTPIGGPDATPISGAHPESTALPTALITATPPNAASEPPSSTTTSIPLSPVATVPALTGIAAELARISKLVSEIRELSADGEPNVALVDRDRIAAELAEDLDDPEVLAEIADLEVLLKLLGLIPQDESLLEIERRLLEGAVIGLYNHDTGELLVLGGGEEVSATEESVYSHEYVHLLQDVNFGLGELFDKAEEDSERMSALQALAEGEATFIETIYVARQFTDQDLAELFDIDPDSLAALEAAPDFLRLALQWPYIVGFEFVNSLWRQGGMSALDAAWADLPETTEQIIHPEKYHADEYPESAPSLPDLAAILGAGWDVRDVDVLGEAYIGIWLEALGADRNSALRAADGWGRDGYVLLDGPSGGSALGLLIEWDDPATDALQFSTAIERALDAADDFARLDGGSATIAVWDGPGGVLAFALDETTGAAGVAVAPTLDQATALLNALVGP